MSDNPITENPNDRMPSGKPLAHDEIVPEDGDDHSTDGEVAGDGSAPAGAQALEEADNDLVNVGKFTDPSADA